MSQDIDDINKYKLQREGFIVFVGELYDENLLTPKIIGSCIRTLFNRISQKQIYAIEYLYNLMLTIGKNYYDRTYDDAVSCFKKIETIADDKKSGFSLKDRFKLSGLLDIRDEEKWDSGKWDSGKWDIKK